MTSSGDSMDLVEPHEMRQCFRDGQEGTQELLHVWASPPGTPTKLRTELPAKEKFLLHSALSLTDSCIDGLVHLSSTSHTAGARCSVGVGNT